MLPLYLRRCARAPQPRSPPSSARCRPSRLPRRRIKRFLGWWLVPSGAGDRFSDAGLFHLLNGEAVVGFIRYLLAERSLAPASVAQAALTIQKGVQWCAHRSAARASQPLAPWP